MCALLMSASMMAGVTTYTFTNAKWSSKVGASACDGKTDGWKSDKDGAGYSAPTTYVSSVGVKVTKGYSGAGATSIKSFTNIRKIKVNFSQNASDGRGCVYIQVGENAYDSLIVNKPESGKGIYLRDSVIRMSTQNSGKVKFWVKCTNNSIYINSLSIYAEEGGSTPFTTSSFQLVTDVAQLQDSDQIIIGVHATDKNFIMGYFDETVSSNNIHAIKGSYTADRQEVAANDNAIYTLRKGTTTKGVEAWYIQDELRYEEAYLVASGGKTKNRLAVWNHLYDEKTYGNYGYWDIQIKADGEATIMNLGNSVGKYLQYNAGNNPTLFGCYESLSQTAVCIYREVSAIGDVKEIVVPLTNFGTQILSGEAYTGKKTITISANRLTEDIHVSLKHGEIFRLDTNLIDRDGDELTIYCEATEAGKYLDTLVVEADGLRREALVMLTLESEKTVAEATMASDYTNIYLNPVVVTKKYDTYIFVRDATGDMLIYDNGDGTGHRYGSGLENGHVLTGVTGKYWNYFGVPELSPTKAWKVEAQKASAEPEVVTSLDSADVCRYVHIDNAFVEDYKITLAGKEIAVEDRFNIGITQGVTLAMNAIVYIDHDVLTLWPVSQLAGTGTNDIESLTEHSGCVLKDGILYIQKNGELHTLTGQKIQ